MTIDNDTLELLERRMSERVEKRVRNRLFAIYGLMGTALLGALGWFGYDIVRDFRATMDETAISTARSAAIEAVGDAVADAESAATAAREAASRATAEATEAQAKLNALDEWRQQGQSRLSITLDKVSDVSANIDASLESIRSKLDEADNRINLLRDKSDLTYLGTEYAEIITQLADEVGRLDSELARLADYAGVDNVAMAAAPDPVDPPVTSGDNPPPPSPANERIYSTRTLQFKEILESLNSPASATIFVQFTGADRVATALISKELRDAGYDMPGAEQTRAAKDLHEIRYFFEDEKAAAEQAADDVNLALTRLKYEADVTAKSFANYDRGKPRRGVFELWLDLGKP